MPWAAAGAIGGALITAGAAGDAADKQSEVSQQSTQMQMMMAAQQRQDLMPWMQAGTAAQNKLSQYLGTGNVGTSGTTSLGLSTGLTPAQVREQLLSRFTIQPSAAGQSTGPDLSQMSDVQRAAYQRQQEGGSGAFSGAGNGPGYWGNEVGTTGQREWVSTAAGGGAAAAPQYDEAGLSAAIDKYYAEQDAQNKAMQSDPNYGSLLKAYRNGEEFDPGPAFSFTGENLASDPGYKFGLDQGLQGIDRAQASRGNFLSGGAIKEATRYNEDYAGTKFDNAFNRNLSTYSTNLNARKNAWDTNLGAYDSNRNTIYNFLTGQSTIGQNAAARVGAGSQQAASAAGQNIAAAGNAQSAASIVGGNALTSGLNSLANTFRSSSNPSSATGWNSLISAGSTPYGASSTSVSGGQGWSAPTNFFSGTNGRI